MQSLTMILFERIGLLLLFAFMMSRIPSFKYLLDRELKGKTVIYHSLIFGFFGILAAQAGVLYADGKVISHLWITSIPNHEVLVGSSLVAIVIAGLFGGPFVGLGSGIVVAFYMFYLGGEGTLANILVHPFAGLLAGYTARFFSDERVIAPEKALFIGMFTPILHMCFLLIFTSDPAKAISLVNIIGIPLVITNSVAIAVFTAMIQVVLKEKDQVAAIETERALKIADLALPFLKQGFNMKSSASIAKILMKELSVAAVSLTDQKRVLAHVGLGADHHVPGQPIQTKLSMKAIQTGDIQVAYQREKIMCQTLHCPLQAAIIVPVLQSGEVRGLIKMYFKRPQQIREVEIALAQGLGKLISNQLDVIAMERMKELIQEAELRNLQAQINPHFLFNTLHSIDSLIRIDPELARHLIVQLSTFMRFNLKLASVPLIPLEKEIQHVKAYIEIIKVRFSDQLDIEFDIPENMEPVKIPPFTLQPLIENCLVHGLKNVERDGEIRVTIAEEDNGIVVKIQDNGRGFPWGLLHRLGRETLSLDKGNGTGIYNVNQRIISLLGAEAHLSFENLQTGGAQITFYLPEKVRMGEKYENQSAYR